MKVHLLVSEEVALSARRWVILGVEEAHLHGEREGGGGCRQLTLWREWG
ncbi:MAG: hypothetical protein IJ196_00230 [Prevotella sp.]|nr:hypothetical protein [Prevotella sp.]